VALRIYVDECVNGVLVSGLRHRGVDLVTSAEEGLLGADDSQHFARAIALDRVLLTADEDFLPLVIGLLRRGGAFPGLIYILPRTSVGSALRAILVLSETATTLHNSIEWIS